MASSLMGCITASETASSQRRVGPAPMGPMRSGRRGFHHVTFCWRSYARFLVHASFLLLRQLSRCLEYRRLSERSAADVHRNRRLAGGRSARPLPPVRCGCVRRAVADRWVASRGESRRLRAAHRIRRYDCCPVSRRRRSTSNRDSSLGSRSSVRCHARLRRWRDRIRDRRLLRTQRHASADVAKQLLERNQAAALGL